MDAASNILGFLAALVLWFPGWRASRFLRTVHEVQVAAAVAAERGDAYDPGPALVDKLERQSLQWNRGDHVLLMMGFLLLCASFVAGFLAGW